MADDYRNILKNEGFEPIGSLNCDFQITLWWHGQLHLELELVELVDWVLLRASKHYRLTAIGKDGELYARDLAALDSYLTTHFEEIHFWSSSFRDVTPSIASRRIQEKNFRHIANSENVDTDEMSSNLQRICDEISVAQNALQRDEGLMKLNRGKSNLLQYYLPSQISEKRRHLETLKAQKKTLTQQLAAQNHLEKQYLHKAEATCLLFTCCSNIQIAGNQIDFIDAMSSVVRELENVDKYQIRQKLQGGRLRIYIEQVTSPAVSLLTRWVGAALNPRQLAGLGPEFADLSITVEEQFMIFPREDILMGGTVQDMKKLVNTRVVQNFLKKLEVLPAAANRPTSRLKSKMPVWIGNVSNGVAKSAEPWELPIDRTIHMTATGKTGSGKSFTARVIVEGCVAYRNLRIVILDPRNQWVGLLCPEDRPEIIEHYKSFGLESTQARSFNFIYHGIGLNIGEPLPDDLRQLANGFHIVSFKGLDDRSRCLRFAEILNGLFDACSRLESDRPRLLVVVEEAIRFSRKGVNHSDHGPAQAAEQSVDRIAREGRKFGLILLLLTQSATDYSHSTSTIRQNITTRIFMQNSDKEIDYASDWLPDSKEIVQLPRGEALVCNPEWGTIRVSIRPPLSKVWEPSDEQTRKLVNSNSQGPVSLSDEARTVLEMATELQSQRGRPARLASITEKLGITSRRRIGHIVDELKRASAAKFERLDKQGKPLVIVPIGVHKACINCAQTRTKGET